MAWVLVWVVAAAAGAVAWVLGRGNELDPSFFNTAAQVSAGLAVALVFQKRAPFSESEKLLDRLGRALFQSAIFGVTVLGIGGGLVGSALDEGSGGADFALWATTGGLTAGVLGLLVHFGGWKESFVLSGRRE